MVAAKTLLPVLGVPIETGVLHGIDSLLSIVQMPAGIGVGTMSIGRDGATNAALLATAILSGKHPEFRDALQRYRVMQARDVLDHPNPRKESNLAPYPSAIVTEDDGDG